MKEEDIIKICEEIEAKYMDLDSYTWYEICEILLSRAN
jgi:hypothetical protein